MKAVSADLDFIKKYKQNRNIKILNNTYNKGQSYSIYKGVTESSHDTIVTLDGDGKQSSRHSKTIRVI